MTSFLLSHRAKVIAIWALLSLVGAISARFLGPQLDYSYATPGQPGYDANVRIAQRFSIDPAFESTLAILHLPEDRDMGTVEGQRIAAQTFESGSMAGPMALADYQNTHDISFILENGRATWAMIALPNPDYGAGRGLQSILERALEAAVPPGATVAVTGFAQMLCPSGLNSTAQIEAVTAGCALTLVILFLLYGSAIALLPLLMAVPATCATLAGVLALTQVAHVSYFVQYMTVLLSFAMSVDFTLVVVIRWREERARGRTDDSAVRQAMRSAGRTVMTGGLTASFGLLSLVLLPVPFLRSVGFASVLIPLFAVLVTMSLLPVALSLVGARLERLRLFEPALTIESAAWTRWAMLVLRHRGKAALIGLTLLTVVALPAFFLQPGEPLMRSLPQGTSARGDFQSLQRNDVPAAVGFPIYLMTHGGAAAVEQARAIAVSMPAVYTVLAPDGPAWRRGDDGLLAVIPRVEGSRPQGRALVGKLRNGLRNLPGGPAEVGGSTAEDMSLTAAVYDHLPAFLGLTSIVTCLILALALRSPALAIKAVFLNLMSLGAALGFMVVFWQMGFGSDAAYGMEATGAIRAWVPVIVFASLFGISINYEVFVLARIREEYDRGRSTSEAIICGLTFTGRLVTCAALVLVITFIAIAASPNQLVKIAATTLAVGIAIDALVVRLLLIPALVSLLGRWNWWPYVRPPMVRSS